MRRIDERVGRTVGRKAGLSKWLGGGVSREATAAVFVPVKEGGLGMESMVARRRKVVLESVLTWLNRAVLGGVDATAADELWLEAWREEVVADGGEASWAEKVSSNKVKDKERHGRGDLLAACRMVAGKMGLQIRDTRPERERGIRKEWDVRLLEMLRAASGEELGLGAAKEKCTPGWLNWSEKQRSTRA